MQIHCKHQDVGAPEFVSFLDVQTPRLFFNLSSITECTLCSGQVSHWILGKTVGNSFIGSLAANCTDGLALPKIAYGFNGTSDCASGLYNETAVSNEGYKLLGNFSYRCG